MRLRNLVYRESELYGWKKITLLVCLIGWHRWSLVKPTLRALFLLHYLAFLKYGRYRCPIERIHSIQPVHPNLASESPIAMEYLNSVVMLNGVTESVTYIWPILNVSGICKWCAQRVFPSIGSNTERSTTTLTGCAKCARCPIEMAIQASCGHVYCYYCLAVMSYQSEGRMSCVECGELISTCTRVL